MKKKNFTNIILFFLGFVFLSSNLISLDTYATWASPGNRNRGYMYIYTCNYPLTDLTLTYATTPDTTMSTVEGTWTGIGPLQPVAIVGPFANRYFHLSTTYPVIWEVEEPITGHHEDSHDILPAADSGNDYVGSIFMTYLRDDTGDTDNAHGDQIAIINPPNATGNITVAVRRWTGAAWGAVIATSPAIPPGGIWMWSPEAAAFSYLAGGTGASTQGHYRFDISGGEGILWKGNSFTPAAGGNRDNVMLNGADVITGKKIGTDLIGACVDGGYAPHITVTNQGTGPANFQIMRFEPETPGTAWPVSGLNPSGTWTVIETVTSLGPGDTYFFDNFTHGGKAGFFRVVSINGERLTAIFGGSLIQQTWCDGDYLNASDTQRAYGRRFIFGGRLWAASGTLQLHVIAPNAGTQVTVSIQGTAETFPTTVKTTTVPQAGLYFPITPTKDGYYTCTILSTDIIYAYVMSDDTNQIAETFFSIPPPIYPLIIINKSVNRSTASPGDTITYQFLIESIGSSTINNVKIWDTLPSGTTFIYSDPIPQTPPPSPPLYVWNLGTMPSGATRTVTVAVRIDSGTQMEVKWNHAIAGSDDTEPFDSNNVPVTILIPGIHLTKSASHSTRNPGETVMYSLSYTDPRVPNFSTIQGLNLEVLGNGCSGQQRSFKYRITNNSGMDINITDLMICSWVSETQNPSGISFNNDYGGNTSPYIWGGPGWSGTATLISPIVNFPVDRQANMRICWWPTTSLTLPTATVWYDIQHRNMDSSNWDNCLDDYSRETSAVYVNNPYFALYYNGQLVREQTSLGVPDTNTGCEPNPVQIYDTIPDEINFIDADSGGIITSGVISWTLWCVQPGETITVRWRGTVKAGTPAGTIIHNVGSYISLYEFGISNDAQVSVSSSPVSTQTNTSTFTNTASFTATYSYTPTSTLTNTQTNTQTQTPTFTPTNSFTNTNSYTNTITNTITDTITNTSTNTKTATRTQTNTYTNTITNTLTNTNTNNNTNTNTFTLTDTPSFTETNTRTSTQTNTATFTDTVTGTQPPTWTDTDTPTDTSTYTYTNTSTNTYTQTYTSTPTNTRTNTMTNTITASSSPTDTPTDSPSPTLTDTFSNTSTGTNTNTFTFTATNTATFTNTSTITDTFTATQTDTPTYTFTSTITFTDTITPTNTLTGTDTSTFTWTFTGTATPTITATLPPFPYMITINIYNEAGEIVKEIASMPSSGMIEQALFLVNNNEVTLLKTGEQLNIFLPGVETPLSVNKGGTTFIWDGKNNTGQNVENGVYYIKIEEKDSYGHINVLIKNISVIRMDKYVEVNVFNSAGEIVRTIKVEKDFLPERIELKVADMLILEKTGGCVVLNYGKGLDDYVVWDGKNNNGFTVSSGTYEIQVKVLTDEGRLEYSSKTVIILNEGRQYFEDIKAVHNSYYKNGEDKITFIWSGEGTGYIRAVIYNIKGELIRILEGKFELKFLQWNLRTAGNQEVSPGIYICVFEAKDPAGHINRKELKIAIVRK